MAKPRHLESPPIAEAVIELRFPEPIKWPESPPSFFIKSGYSLVSVIMGHSFEITNESNEVVKSDQQVGWQVVDQSNNKMIRIESDKIIVSKMSHYVDWEDLESGLFLALPFLQEFGVGQKASRLGTRFVNRIPVPDGEVYLADFLINGPVLPSIADQVIEFLLRTVHVDLKTNCMISRLVSGEANPGARPAILLDIDVFSRQELEVNENTLKIKLGQLRNLKNIAFFESVTEKALEGM